MEDCETAENSHSMGRWFVDLRPWEELTGGEDPALSFLSLWPGVVPDSHQLL